MNIINDHCVTNVVFFLRRITDKNAKHIYRTGILYLLRLCHFAKWLNLSFRLVLLYLYEWWQISDAFEVRSSFPTVRSHVFQKCTFQRVDSRCLTDQRTPSALGSHVRYPCKNQGNICGSVQGRCEAKVLSFTYFPC